MKEKSIVGDLINFRGLVYSPINENGTIFLFGKVAEDLNMYVEEIKPGFPDCVARRFTGKGWERIFVEFEHTSLNFKDHKHDHRECDLIVCWEHNWQDCPIEVIELREVIKSLPNPPTHRPDRLSEADEYSLEEHVVQFPEKVQKLFQELDRQVLEISENVWHKVTKVVTYYSPERVFIYLHLQKQGLKLEVFTRGETIEGVKSFGYKRGGAKWGVLYLTDITQTKNALQAIKRSYALIKEAVKNNEPTGWYADLEEAQEEDEELPLDERNAE
jgi:predicted transport protein